jgi:hypothetical protein
MPTRSACGCPDNAPEGRAFVGKFIGNFVVLAPLLLLLLLLLSLLPPCHAPVTQTAVDW